MQYQDARLDNPDANNGFLFSSIDQTFPAKWVTDLTLGVQLTKQIGLTIGANNIFDVYPDKYRLNELNNPQKFAVGALAYNSSRDNTNRGRTIYNPNQFGYKGGFYFARLSVTLPTN